MDKRDVAGLHRIEIRHEMAGRQPLHHHRARAPALIGETMAQVDRGGDMFYLPDLLRRDSEDLSAESRWAGGASRRA